MMSLRNPVNDAFGHIFTHQNFGPCRDFELHFYECMEAYGMPRGWKKCSLELDDFMECTSRKKQMARVEAMRKERFRQWQEGKRSYRNYNAPPPKIDSY